MFNKLVLIILLILMTPAVIAKIGEKDYVYDIPVTNGYGERDLEDWGPVPIPTTVEVTASILSPPNGTWTLEITVDDVTVFKESGIDTTTPKKQRFLVKPHEKDNVDVYACWSEKANTTLRVHANGKIIFDPTPENIGRTIISPVKGIVKGIGSIF